MEAVSSSDDIGVETKITAYREPIEGGTQSTSRYIPTFVEPLEVTECSMHPDSRRETRSDGVLAMTRKNYRLSITDY